MKNSMIKIVILSLAIAAFSSLTAAENKSPDTKGSHKPGLVQFPYPMKVLLPNMQEFKVDKEQEAKINEILTEVPEKMHTMMDASAALEHAIKKDVVKNKKTLKDVGASLEKLQRIKRDISNLQINTLNRLQEILSADQYSALFSKLRGSHQCK